MNVAPVPDFENPIETRRRSLSCIQGLTCLQDRRLSAPSTRLITRRSSWGPIWELRKQFLPHLRRISSGDYNQQVKFSVVSNFELLDTRSFPLGKVCVRARSKFEIVIFCGLGLARGSNQCQILGNTRKYSPNIYV